MSEHTTQPIDMPDGYVVGEIYRMDPADIQMVISRNITRPYGLDNDAVMARAESMEKEGQLQPIGMYWNTAPTVCLRGHLDAGFRFG